MLSSSYPRYYFWILIFNTTWIFSNVMLHLTSMIFHTTMVWNIGKYEYIDTWIWRIYRKYQRNIDGYFDKNIGKLKIIQNS